MDSIILEKISKCYKLRKRKIASYGIERLLDLLGLTQGKTKKHLRREIWALKDVSLSVKRGTILGIIGKNGAGKTTLLKILARITLPTSGRAILRGKVVSLLEIGTGFHPEFTARENIFLNAAIYGISRREIMRVFDQIISFAGLEKFVDTPVRHYSSGMYLRLAFSMVIHMSPEILLADEVLAVGDIEFQRKCLSKLEEIGREGATILFVSHDMDAVRRLCNRCIRLDRGSLVDDGNPEEVILRYQRALDEADVIKSNGSYKNDFLEVVSIELCSLKGDPIGVLKRDCGGVIEVRIKMKSDEKIFLSADFYVKGVIVFRTTTDKCYDLKKGNYTIRLFLPKDLLAELVYKVNIAITVLKGEQEIPLLIHDAISFRVYDPHEQYLIRHNRVVGMIRPKIEWNVVAWK